MEYIENAGRCMVTTNALQGRGRIRWANREEPMGYDYSGWRILSEIDEARFLTWRWADFNEVCALEPALASIRNLPVGSRLRLDHGAQAGTVFIDEATGQPVPEDKLLAPGDTPDSDPEQHSHQRAQDLAVTIMRTLTGIMADGWEEFTAKASVVGDRLEWMLWVRFGEDDWLLMPSREEYFAPVIRQFRDASYDPVEGAWFLATWNAVREKEGQVVVDPDVEPPFSNPVRAREYVADLQRYPRAPEHIPEWLAGKLLICGVDINFGESAHTMR